MGAFEKLTVSEKITKGGKTVEIYKYNKVGTNRLFFAPEIEGKRINSTMYARLYDASKLARMYLERISLK